MKHGVEGDDSVGRRQANTVAVAGEPVLGPLPPIDPLLALAYEQDMLAYDREEPIATEQAAVEGDSAWGTSDRFGHCFTIQRVQECLKDKNSRRIARPCPLLVLSFRNYSSVILV